jgi:hypothetical protein
MANDKVTFSLMTFQDLESRYGIREGRRKVLFEGCAPVAPSTLLVDYLKRTRRSGLINERAKANRLVDPVIAELEVLREGQIQALPEVSLYVKGIEGLAGWPDYIISGGNVLSKIVPILAIIEAKKDDIEAGIPQCIAELYAAYLLNGDKPIKLHGCVTTGLDWKLLRLEGATKVARVDVDTYSIFDLPPLLGVLCHIVDTALVELKEQLPPP